MKAGENAKAMTNLRSNPKGKRGLAIPLKYMWLYRKCSFGLADVFTGMFICDSFLPDYL